VLRSYKKLREEHRPRSGGTSPALRRRLHRGPYS
jgi:hypothetical protein